MRTVDLARRAGCSVQQVRKLEDAGVLPPAPRTTSGYRQYDNAHLHSLCAYQQLAGAVGPVEARRVLNDAHRDRGALLARLDACHAHLHQERRELAAATDAVRAIACEPMQDSRPSDVMTVGELAEALGVKTSTLRHWEAERLLTPARTEFAARRYGPTDVRTARIIHQLRRAGYRIAPLRELLPSLHDPRDWERLRVERERSIDARADALFQATATLVNITSTNCHPAVVAAQHPCRMSTRFAVDFEASGEEMGRCWVFGACP